LLEGKRIFFNWLYVLNNFPFNLYVIDSHLDDTFVFTYSNHSTYILFCILFRILKASIPPSYQIKTFAFSISLWCFSKNSSIISCLSIMVERLFN
jgi:hypothetical protein